VVIEDVVLADVVVDDARLLEHEHGALGQLVLAQTPLVVQQLHCPP
jgi:hypothetical protein